MMGGRARAALVIGLIVICSALAGAAVERMLMQRGSPRRGGPGGQGGPGGGRPSREMDQRRRADMLDHMTKDLGLTAAQRAGIDSVMQRTDSSLRAIRSEMQPRTEAVFKASRAEIGARLDPAQRARFESMRPTQRRRP
jgi:hypothetical protein